MDSLLLSISIAQAQTWGSSPRPAKYVTSSQSPGSPAQSRPHPLFGSGSSSASPAFYHAPSKDIMSRPRPRTLGVKCKTKSCFCGACVCGYGR